MKHCPFTYCVILLLGAQLLLPSRAAAAGSPAQQVQPGLSTPEELETFVDGVIAAQLTAYHVIGATISVVKDGELFFAKGYGTADLEQRIPVEADQTLFRPGSVSKLFTWTAVMQLVEQGRLDLDADINTYLDFQIPETYLHLSNSELRPITLRHLLTHTPGFEDRGLGIFSRTEEEMVPLSENLSGNIPRRIFPPGEISAYSNYGAGLAGYIVERTSGIPFEEYVETYILEPLGMAHSTFRQPLPADLAENMSQGYIYAGGRYQEGVFEFVQPSPAGALSATATDIAAFMIAHLQNGQYGNVRILEEETAREMHALQFTHDERLQGWGLGFSTGRQNNMPSVGHGGDTVYFHSELVLLPEENVGIFISTNTNTGTFMRFDFIQEFFARYYPVPPADPPQPPPDFEQRAPIYTGTYYPARLSYTTAEKALALLGPLTIRVTQDGQLQANGLLGSGATYWVEAEPMVLTSVSEWLPADTHLVFSVSEETLRGENVLAYFGPSAYIKQPWYGGSGFHLGLIGLSLFVFLAAFIAVPVRGMVHRHYRGAAPEAIPAAPWGARLALWIGWSFALINLVFWLVFMSVMSDINNVIFGLPPVMEIMMYIPWITTLLLVGILVFAVAAWIRKYWTPSGRIFYTLLALVGLAHLWFLAYWNIIIK